MKNLFLGTALCALVVTGCSKLDEAEAVQPEQGKVIDVTINATRYTTPSTRTAYEEGTNALIVKWRENDQLGVFTEGSTKAVGFSVSNVSPNGKVADFNGNLPVSDPDQETTVYGFCPYSQYDNNNSSKAKFIHLDKQAQSGSSLGVLAGYDYLAATPVTKKFSNEKQNLSLIFHPLLTILSFEIKKEIQVKEITLEAIGDHNTMPFYTRGTVDITTLDNSFPITLTGTATNVISLQVNQSETIESGKSGMFSMTIFPIEPDKMPAQFKVTVITTDNKIYTQTKTAPTNGFVRGKRSIMELHDLTEEAWPGEGIEANPYQIATAEDLVRLSSQVNRGVDVSGKYFKLMNDIDLENKEWIPIGGPKKDYPPTAFRGIFDGNKQTISNMKITTAPKDGYIGLFGYVDENASIKDLTVEGEINITTDISDLFVGGILGASGNNYATEAAKNVILGGTLTNKVNITITQNLEKMSDHLLVGGVVGGIYKGTSTNSAQLSNEGNLIIKCSTTEAYPPMSVGGIFGYLEPAIQVSTMKNIGAITVSGDKEASAYVGGLIGKATEAVTSTGSNTNTGNIMATGSSTYCGGFLGYADVGIDMKPGNASNSTGKVTGNSIVPGGYSCVGIRVGYGVDDMNTRNLNSNEDGTPGSTDGLTATIVLFTTEDDYNGESRVNGILTSAPAS